MLHETSKLAYSCCLRGLFWSTITPRGGGTPFVQALPARVLLRALARDTVVLGHSWARLTLRDGAAGFWHWQVVPSVDISLDARSAS